MSKKPLNDGVALCQMIPGATAMQTAAYVGLKARGAIGAGVSYIAFGLPAFLLMTMFAALYTSATSHPVVNSAFNGLQAIIVAIIANATLSFGKTILKDWRTFLVAGIAAIMFMLHVNPIIVILSAAAGGLVLFKRTQSRSHPAGSSDQKVSTIKPLLLILSASLIGFVHLFFCNRSLFDLAVLLFRIDLFAFGGGFASIPLMLHEIVTVRHWLDDQTFMHAIVLGQVTPGPIVITATFIGYFLYGLTGAVIATVSIFLPSFMAVLGFSAYFDRMRSSPLFNHVIGGVLCSFVGLLLTTTIRFALNANWDIPHLLLAAAALVALLLKVDILWVVLMGTIISMIALA